MKVLPKTFENREQLIQHVKNIAPWSVGDISLIVGGHAAAVSKLRNIDPINYGKTRNFGQGKITGLSPYVHHGVLSLNEVRNYAIAQCTQPGQIINFIQELAWRDFWQRVAENHPAWLWDDVEPYKTGYLADDYEEVLPDDILNAGTGVACIDAFINDLIKTGYVHNHARMYLASYVVHFRHIKWQAGAKWFLAHLLDGDEASNNLSWQWVASTLSNKPYIFNLENVEKYFGGIVDTAPQNNQILHASYQELTQRLFPNLEGIHHE